MSKKKCESCGVTLVEDEFDICEKCMMKGTAFIEDIEDGSDELGDVDDEYFEHEY